MRQNLTLRARGQTIELEANAAASASTFAERLSRSRAADGRTDGNRW